MTENDIRGHVLALVGAIVQNNETVALKAATELGTQVLVDLNRIANALEHLATKGEK